ncbi:MAG TPA: hypothetical protein VLK82_18670 [Candidatus Tectomicrobia bacterium]|nr:hypothetical protein [Candidatus Tectomicrobia bacterium]
MVIKSLIVAGACIAVLAAWMGGFLANPVLAQGDSEHLGCRQLYQSYSRCYETGKGAAYDVCVAAAHHISEELLGRSGQNHPHELAVRALESACLLGCEMAKADRFLAYGDFERAMCP